MKKILIVLLAILTLFLIGCSQTTETNEPAADTPEEETGEKVFTIGAIAPLTGEGAVYGLPVQRVTQQAVADLNEQWKDKNMKLEVIYEDGKCNGRDALTAAQSLVNLKNVNLIFGGTCSGETLGVAPFAEENEVIVFSSLSSSPEITNAGDYIFRNYPSDTAQVAVMVDLIVENGHETVALLSENTDYAQALRKGYQALLAEKGVNIVADEAVAPNTKDVRTEMLKIKNSEADAVVLIPQTIPTGGVFAKQYVESGIDAQGYGNDVFVLQESLDEYATEMEGFYGPTPFFEKENDGGFLAVAEATECELGFYCASTYDGVFLLGELLETCGEDTGCIKDELYRVENWEGPYAGPITIDENGDVGGVFKILKVEGGELVEVN